MTYETFYQASSHKQPSSVAAARNCSCVFIGCGPIPPSSDEVKGAFESLRSRLKAGEVLLPGSYAQAILQSLPPEKRIAAAQDLMAEGPLLLYIIAKARFEEGDLKLRGFDRGQPLKSTGKAQIPIDTPLFPIKLHLEFVNKDGSKPPVAAFEWEIFMYKDSYGKWMYYTNK